jgi:hypothetical protein
MNCIALSRNYPLPETFITAAIMLLSSDIDRALAATLLGCFSGLHAKKQRRSEFSAIACHYLQCDSAAVRHSALKLSSQNYQIEMLKAGFVCEAMNAVIELVKITAIHTWYPFWTISLNFLFPSPLIPLLLSSTGLTAGYDKNAGSLRESGHIHGWSCLTRSHDPSRLSSSMTSPPSWGNGLTSRTTHCLIWM